jgi:hypothetical protein
MDLRLVTLKAVSFYFLHKASTLKSMQKIFLCHSCDFARYQDYPNCRWDFIR